MKLRPPSLLERCWCMLASERFTFILVVLLSLVVLVANLVPQGREAIDIAMSPEATPLHEAARWGLTDIFKTPWIKALGVLFAANILSMLANHFLGKANQERVALRPPQTPKLRSSLQPKFPEKAFPQVRNRFEALFGYPRAESMESGKTIMVFDSNQGALWNSMLGHIGLVAILLGIALHAIHFDEASVSPQAILKVTDRATGSSGVFNLRAGETREFFTYPDSYLIRNYKRTKGGLGPAILLERRRKDAKRGESFWVYLNAPAGFDQRHRNGQVSIEALKLGRTPLPGAGLINSPIVLLLLGGLAAMLLGLKGPHGGGGRIWVEMENRDLSVSGIPFQPSDPDFESEFAQCIKQLERTLEQA